MNGEGVIFWNFPEQTRGKPRQSSVSTDRNEAIIRTTYTQNERLQRNPTLCYFEVTGICHVTKGTSTTNQTTIYGLLLQCPRGEDLHVSSPP